MATQSSESKSRRGTIVVTVLDKGSGAVATDAKVSLYAAPDIDSCDNFSRQKPKWTPKEENRVGPPRRTHQEGRVTFDGLEPGCYVLDFGHTPRTDPQCVCVRAGCIEDVCFELELYLEFTKTFLDRDCKPIDCAEPRVGDNVMFQMGGRNLEDAIITPPRGSKIDPTNRFKFSSTVRKAGPETYTITVSLPEIDAPARARGTDNMAKIFFEEQTDASEASVVRIGGNVGATLSRTETEPTADVALWVAIRNSTEALSFTNYLRFMDWIFCGKDERTSLNKFEANRFPDKRGTFRNLVSRPLLPFTDTDAYRVVKAATDAFVMVNCGVISDFPPFTADGDRDLDEDYLDRRDIPAPGKGLSTAFTEDYLESVNGTSTLPYLAIIRRKLPDIPIKARGFEQVDMNDESADNNCFGLLQRKLAHPCLLELIWSYWHEEGMLVQTVNAITRRFQNVRAPSPSDPLSNLEIDPLRPLNNIFWGYIQDEQNRLTVVRRNYEYDHHYGLRLEGQAVQHFRPADTRSKFLEAFHHLLRLCTVFYKQDDDTTVKADAFPVLNALKETHLILSQGAHNQFGDLPSTARVEMLIQEWLLARPEFREYLPTRIMVAYPEPWMDRVDAMKKIQGWSDTSVLHFRNLGIFGEQLLLAIRWGAWSDVQEPIQAFNWTRFFRPQVQGYIHAYRAVTGVDLAAEVVDTQVDATLPSVLLKKRLAMRQRA